MKVRRQLNGVSSRLLLYVTMGDETHIVRKQEPLFVKPFCRLFNFIWFSFGGRDRVSLHISGCSETHYINQPDIN